MHLRHRTLMVRNRDNVGGMRLVPRDQIVAQIAWYVSEGKDDDEINRLTGVEKASIRNLRSRDDFQTKVAEYNAEAEAAMKQHGIACRTRRLQGMLERHAKLMAIVGERAESEIYNGVPGGQTGYIVLDTKRGFILDRGILQELRELEKQIAQECGQGYDQKQVGGIDLAQTIVVNCGQGTSTEAL